MHWLAVANGPSISFVGWPTPSSTFWTTPIFSASWNRARTLATWRRIFSPRMRSLFTWCFLQRFGGCSRPSAAAWPCSRASPSVPWRTTRRAMLAAPRTPTPRRAPRATGRPPPSTWRTRRCTATRTRRSSVWPSSTSCSRRSAPTSVSSTASRSPSWPSARRRRHSNPATRKLRMRPSLTPARRRWSGRRRTASWRCCWGAARRRRSSTLWTSSSRQTSRSSAHTRTRPSCSSPTTASSRWMTTLGRWRCAGRRGLRLTCSSGSRSTGPRKGRGPRWEAVTTVSRCSGGGVWDVPASWRMSRRTSLALHLCSVSRGIVRVVRVLRF